MSALARGFTVVLSFAAGAAMGFVLTFTHRQYLVEVGPATIPLGLIGGLGIVAALLAGMRLAHPATSGTRILRRGYNFVDGSNDLGQLAAGLFFISMQRSPEQFSAVQRSLATDAMNEYIRHVSSAVFAVPPGAREGSYVGAALFD